MLCEGRLWSMTYSDLEDLEPLCPQNGPLHGAHGGPQRAAAAPLIHHGQTSGVAHGRSPSRGFQYISPLQSLDVHAAHPTDRQMSQEIEIPAQVYSGADSPFLVPSSCQSICQNYSDLHIGGDQVLPLSASDGELRLCCADVHAAQQGPFLQSCDVLPAVEEDSSSGQRPQGGLANPPRGGSNRWRQGSARDRSFLFQGREGPFSNSLLNRYLEQKLLDLYQQYMMENMAREGGPGSDSDPGAICPLLGSEMVLTSLDQITLQLSKEGNLEAGQAKDMVLSCLLRVAGDMHSCQISTPVLQISSEASGEQLTEHKEEE